MGQNYKKPQILRFSKLSPVVSAGKDIKTLKQTKRVRKANAYLRVVIKVR